MKNYRYNYKQAMAKTYNKPIVQRPHNLVLTDEQSALVEYASNPQGNFACLARAGSGKSAMGCEIVNRAKFATQCYIQFNKKNQVEMAGRVTRTSCTVTTFHSACNRFITKNWGFMRAEKFWADANRTRDIDSKCVGLPLNEVVKLVSALKNECPFVPTIEQAFKIALKYGIEDCESKGYDLNAIVELACKVCAASLDKPKSKQISYDDMIWVPLVNGWLTPIADFVIGDEFQDFNPVQHAAFLKLVGQLACILGDDRQQIYGWRGAVANGFNSMVEKLKAQVFPMTISQRCDKLIVASGAEIVPDFRARDNAEQGEVLNKSFDEMNKQAKVGNAILARTNAPGMSVCFCFLRNGITARIEGKEIGRELENVIKHTGVDNNADSVTFLDKLATWQQVRISKANGWNAASTIDYVTDQADTLKVLAENCNDVPGIVSKIRLLFEDSNGEQKPCVKISTVHKAKGLEWEKVFILNDSFKRRGTQTEEQALEESNVQYVARTRAKHSLNFVKGLAVTPQP